jgi:hypothetical protein
LDVGEIVCVGVGTDCVAGVEMEARGFELCMGLVRCGEVEGRAISEVASRASFMVVVPSQKS